MGYRFSVVELEDQSSTIPWADDYFREGISTVSSHQPRSEPGEDSCSKSDVQMEDAASVEEPQQLPTASDLIELCTEPALVEDLLVDDWPYSPSGGHLFDFDLRDIKYDLDEAESDDDALEQAIFIMV